MREKWQQLEADFQHYYQMDLRREYVSAGVRRLLTLVKGLPPDAAVWDDQRHEQDDSEDVVEPTSPPPAPRPAAKPGFTQPMNNPREIAAFLDRNMNVQKG